MASTTFRDRFKKGLERTRDILNADVEDLVRGRRPLKPEDLDAMEEALIASDFGMAATHDAMEVLRDRSSQVWTGGVPAMRALLRDEIRRTLDRPLAARLLHMLLVYGLPLAMLPLAVVRPRSTLRTCPAPNRPTARSASPTRARSRRHASRGYAMLWHLSR